MTTLFELTNVGKAFRGQAHAGPEVVAVDDVSLNLHEGDVLGIVGESGAGKSTLARLMVGLETPSRGGITYRGVDLHRGSRHELAAVRPRFQMVLQDTYDSLNPRMTVSEIIAYPLKFARWSGDYSTRVGEMLEIVGLAPEHARRFPHAFSGGQRQRVAIARALVANPEVVILDEPVSSLDVSIQAQILNLLSDLRESFGLTYVLIANNLGVVRHACTRVAIMFGGRIVELGAVEDVFSHPQHPYTEALLASRLTASADSGALGGSLMEISRIDNRRAGTQGCIFAPVCPRRQNKCREVDPELADTKVGESAAACHFPAARTRVVATQQERLVG